MRLFTFITIIVMSFFLSGCAFNTSTIDKGNYYSNVYKQHPKSILVLPAVNTTTAADATDLFRYSITQPLTEKGYYVFPVHLVDAFFKSENISDAEIIRDIPIAKLKEAFNPDAILYVNINAWDTGYMVLASHVNVSLSFSLVDTTSENEIWSTNNYACSAQGVDPSNIATLIASSIAVAANTAVDYMPLATGASTIGFATFPDGFYGKKYKNDTNEKLIFLDSALIKEDKLFVTKYFIFGENSDEPVALILKGYHGFFTADLGSNLLIQGAENNFMQQHGYLNLLQHNGYKNYYFAGRHNGKKFLRNKFFKYEGTKPFLFVENKKVFVSTEPDGSIPYSEQNGKYFFNIEQIVDVIPTQS